MCSPSFAALAPSAGTLGNIALGTQIAGGVLGAVGARNRSISDRAAFAYQSAVASYNAELDEIRARDAIARGQVAEVNQRMKTAKLAGAQRARFAARGVALDEGSPFHILADTEFFGDIDADTIRENAAREAWALRNQAAIGRSNAAMLAGRADAENPDMAGFTSLLGSAGNVALTWYRLRTPSTRV